MAYPSRVNSDELLIFREKESILISFNINTKVLTNSDVVLKEKDSFRYLNRPIELNDKLYIFGASHIQIVDLETQSTDILRNRGFDKSINPVGEDDIVMKYDENDHDKEDEDWDDMEGTEEEIEENDLWRFRYKMIF